MKALDILHALRETAMGRANTPMQIELAEKLEKLFATEVHPEAVTLPDVPSIVQGGELDIPGAVNSAKRTRKPKAD